MSFCVYFAAIMITVVVCEHNLKKMLDINRLILQRVEITNNVLISKETVLKKIKLNTQTHIMSINLKDLKNRIMGIEGVRDVVIKRIFPSQIQIKIIEETPLFRLYIGGELIDEFGCEVKVSKGYKHFNHLPRLKGFNLTSFYNIAKCDMKRFESVKTIVDEFHKKILSLTQSEIVLIDSTKDWVDIHLKNELIYRFGLHQCDEIIYDKAVVVTNDIMKNRVKPYMVDFQFKNIIVKMNSQ